MIPDSRVREILTEHAHHPAGKKSSPGNTTPSGHATNPFCGDHLTVYLEQSSPDQWRFSYHGQGCSVCIASASILASTIRASSPNEIKQLLEQAHQTWSDPNFAPQKHTPDEWLALRYFLHNPRKQACVNVPWEAASNSLPP